MFKNTKNSISELWILLKKKEKELGIDQLNLKERETLQHIMYLQGEKEEVELETIYEKNPFPRASFFRYLKTLKEKKYISIRSCKIDSRKTLVSASKLITNKN